MNHMFLLVAAALMAILLTNHGFAAQPEGAKRGRVLRQLVGFCPTLRTTTPGAWR